MCKKHTYEYVKNYIESVEGYKLLSEDYVNAHKKLIINHTICGAEYKTNFNNFKNGNRCPKCGGTQKLTYEEVKSYIESFEGYKLISEEYKNYSTKLIVRHLECGTKYEVKFNNFKNGNRCPKCYGTPKHSYEYVKEYIESCSGYLLLSPEYKDNKSNLLIKHLECGTEYNVRFDSFKSGKRCPFCSIQKAKLLGITGKPLYDFYIDKLGYCEEIRRDPENYYILQIRCKNSGCRKWFTPTLNETYRRLASVKGVSKGENNFYCSGECKHTCPIFNQKVWSKDQKPYKDKLERDPYWRQLVLERDNFECQICGSTEKLEAHHIDSINTNPIMSADIENGITLCKKCHDRVHSEPGCRYVDLTRNQLCGANVNG